MPKVRRKLHKLTPEDKEILALGRHNLNEITSRWIIHPESGTWHVADPTDPKHGDFPRIYEQWHNLGEPEEPFDFNGKVMKPMEVGNNLPDFLHHHGFMFIDWQQLMLFAKQSVHVVIGGFGSAKTMGVGMGAVIFCVLYPKFDFLNLGPIGLQAKEMYDIVLQEIVETPFAERFLMSYRESPYPQIVIGHSGVGTCRMMFMPADNEAKKAKSMTRDWICVDQAEDQPFLTETSLNLRTRLRGTVRGRPRLGRMTYIANSADNDELWGIFDRAEKDPTRYFSINVSYKDNPFLTGEQKADMAEVVGDDPEAQAQHLHGLRVEGGGLVFTKHMIKLCEDPLLDEMMEAGLESELRGLYTVAIQPVVGIHRWMLPPDPLGEYFIFGDGGSDNPPRRNSACIIVVNARGFPYEPARIVGFDWIFGSGSVIPFFQSLTELVDRYKAQGRTFIDTTGSNKGQAQLAQQHYHLAVHPVPFNNIKHFMILDAKFVMANQLFKWSGKIRGVRRQLLRYKLPDEKIPQDIVVTLLMACHVLRPLMMVLKDDSEEKDEEMDHQTRASRSRRREGRVVRQGRG